MAGNDAAELRPPQPPTLLAGLGVALVLVAAIIGWVALGGAFLSETSLFGGFLVLWYWAKVEHLAPQRLAASIIGGLVGIGVAWAMFYGATNYGPVAADPVNISGHRPGLSAVRERLDHAVFNHCRRSSGAAQNQLGRDVPCDCGRRHIFRGMCCGGTMACVKPIETILMMCWLDQ
jgi:hypothetical protein